MASVIHTEGEIEVTRNSLGEWTLRHLEGLTTKLASADEAIHHLVQDFGLTNFRAKRVVSKILKAS